MSSLRAVRTPREVGHFWFFFVRQIQYNHKGQYTNRGGMSDELAEETVQPDEEDLSSSSCTAMLRHAKQLRHNDVSITDHLDPIDISFLHQTLDCCPCPETRQHESRSWVIPLLVGIVSFACGIIVVVCIPTRMKCRMSCSV